MYENYSNMNSSFPDGFETMVSGVDNVTRKGKGRKAALIGGISAAVIAGGAVTSYAVSDTVKNQVKLRVSSPEHYYAWVTEKNSKTIGESVSESYKKMLEKREKGQTLDLKLSFEPSKDAKDMLKKDIFGDIEDEDSKKITDVIDNTNEILLSGSYKLKKNSLNTDFGLLLDGKDIASYELAADVRDMDYFFRIPELKEQWLGFEMGDDSGLYGMNGIINTYKMILEDPAAVISPEELEEEINKYAGIWGSFAEDVKVEKKESVSVCDINVNYTVATVDLTDKDLDELAVKYLEEMKNDKVLRNIIVNKLKAVDDEAEYDDSLDKGISELKDDLAENGYDNETVVSIDTYIDATGTIRGIGFREDDDDSYRLVFGKDGNAVRGEMVVIEGNEPQFSAVLKAEENGKSYSGDVTFTYSDFYGSDEESVYVNFSNVEVKDDEKGYFSGDFSIVIPDADPINISFSSDGKSEEITSDVLIEGTDYGKVKLVYSVKDGADIEMPSKSDAFMVDIENIDDYEDYISSDELAEFVKNTLEKIGIDKELAESGAESFKYGYDKRAEEAHRYDDYDWDSDDFDFDFDFDEDEDDDDDDDFGSTAGDSFIGGSDDDEIDFDFDLDPSQFNYEDYKDSMTKEEFDQWMDLLEQFSKKVS